MNEYLYENGVGKFTNTDLSDEQIVYVVANEKLHANRKRKFKSRSSILMIILNYGGLFL